MEPQFQISTRTVQCGTGTSQPQVESVPASAVTEPRSIQRLNLTNFVSRLGEIEGQIALVDKLLSYIDPVERSNRIQPTSTNLVSDAVLEITQLFLRGLRPQRSLFRSCRIEESVEDRDVNVNPGGAVPACKGLYAVCGRSERNFAHHAQCSDTRQQQVSLCLLKMLCSPVLIILRHNFRSIAVRLITQLVH